MYDCFYNKATLVDLVSSTNTSPDIEFNLVEIQILLFFKLCQYLNNAECFLKIYFLFIMFMYKRYVSMIRKYHNHEGAQRLSGRVLDSRPTGLRFEPHRRH